VWVVLFDVPEANLNPGFYVPLTAGTIISFEETGSLISPETGSPYCVFPPCGDTVSLSLEDNRGNLLAYVLQRAPDAVPNEVHSSYREVFLDPNAGAYSRDLFADFSTIPNFNPSGARIRAINFEIDEHGTATIDNICIGTSGCVPPSLGVTTPNVVGLAQSAAEAAIVAAGLSVGTVTTQLSNTVTAGTVISQAPEGGTEVTPGTEVDFIVSSGTGIQITGTTTNITAPVQTGDTVEFTVNAIDMGSGPHEYRFFVRAGYGEPDWGGNKWTIVQAYSANNRVAYTFDVPGIYFLAGHVIHPGDTWVFGYPQSGIVVEVWPSQ
jgi:hypothetical protein